jgi:hypothetical protein
MIGWLPFAMHFASEQLIMIDFEGFVLKFVQVHGTVGQLFRWFFQRVVHEDGRLADEFLVDGEFASPARVACSNDYYFSSKPGTC